MGGIKRVVQRFGGHIFGWYLVMTNDVILSTTQDNLFIDFYPKMFNVYWYMVYVLFEYI